MERLQDLRKAQHEMLEDGESDNRHSHSRAKEWGAVRSSSGEDLTGTRKRLPCGQIFGNGHLFGCSGGELFGGVGGNAFEVEVCWVFCGIGSVLSTEEFFLPAQLNRLKIPPPRRRRN